MPSSLGRLLHVAALCCVQFSAAARRLADARNRGLYKNKKNTTLEKQTSKSWPDGVGAQPFGIVGLSYNAENFYGFDEQAQALKSVLDQERDVNIALVCTQEAQEPSFGEAIQKLDTPSWNWRYLSSDMHKGRTGFQVWRNHQELSILVKQPDGVPRLERTPGDNSDTTCLQKPDGTKVVCVQVVTISTTATGKGGVIGWLEFYNRGGEEKGGDVALKIAVACAHLSAKTYDERTKHVRKILAAASTTNWKPVEDVITNEELIDGLEILYASHHDGKMPPESQKQVWLKWMSDQPEKVMEADDLPARLDQLHGNSRRSILSRQTGEPTPTGEELLEELRVVMEGLYDVMDEEGLDEEGLAARRSSRQVKRRSLIKASKERTDPAARDRKTRVLTHLKSWTYSSDTRPDVELKSDMKEGKYESAATLVHGNFHDMDAVLLLGDLNYRIDTQHLPSTSKASVGNALVQHLRHGGKTLAEADSIRHSELVSPVKCETNHGDIELCSGFGFQCSSTAGQLPSYKVKRKAVEACTELRKNLKTLPEPDLLALITECYGAEGADEDSWLTKGPDLQLGWLDRLCWKSQFDNGRAQDEQNATSPSSSNSLYEISEDEDFAQLYAGNWPGDDDAFLHPRIEGTLIRDSVISDHFPKLTKLRFKPREIWA